MKYLYMILTALAVFAFTLYLSSFRGKEYSSFPNEQIKADYLRGLELFGQEIAELHKLARVLDSQPQSRKALQKQLTDTRHAYKKIEFIAAYMDEEFAKDYLNGPPLPHLMRNASQLEILEPEGLQILEELAYSEVPEAEKEQIIHLAEKLEQSQEVFLRYQREMYLEDRHVFEAVRFNLIRLYTLGLTGFDTPATLTGIPESAISLKAAYNAMQHYMPLLSQQDAELAASLHRHFEGAIAYLKDNTDFATFDRLEYLRAYIDPLFKMVKDAQLALSIETFYETNQYQFDHPINYFSDHIFSEKLLNPQHYMQLTAERDNEKTVELGRYLFFDPALSGGNDRACASCHNPDKAFTDGMARSLATGMEGTVSRNAPTLLNAVFADRYFFDLRVDVLENQIEHVITDHKEFHTTYLRIFEKLEKSDEYMRLFKEAFPEVKDQPVQKYTIAGALAAYIRSLASFNSPFDKYARGETNDIAPAVKRGYNLFMGKAACGTCHFAPVFNGSVPPLYMESESEVLGVPATTEAKEVDSDLGRGAGVLKEQSHIYKNSFKTTTVRNVALTAPYMHNGVYQTLEEVVDFYNKGGGAGMGLEVKNQTLAPDPLNLTEEEQQDLIAFMEALTDTTGMTSVPKRLPDFPAELAISRKIGGEY